MTEFKKYSSIENDFDKAYMEHVAAEMPADLQYVVQEKVHGVNSSFLCNGKEIRFARRTSILENDEKFYGFQELMETYKEKVMNLFAVIKGRYPDVTDISVFGELFGGMYPHKDVRRDNQVMMIQKRVYYTPVHEFYGYDIYLFAKSGERYLPVAEVNELFESTGFFYARTLFQGTLQECLKYPNRFQTTLPALLGFPAIEDNICEGIVIRPVVPMYLRNGSRVMIKSKNERFAEKSGTEKFKDNVDTKPEYSDELKQLMQEVPPYVTENRLTNVVSHVGEISMPKDFGRIMGMFSKDVQDDFMKEFGEAYSNLEKAEQRLLNKEINKCATEMVKRIYMNRT